MIEDSQQPKLLKNKNVLKIAQQIRFIKKKKEAGEPK